MRRLVAANITMAEGTPSREEKAQHKERTEISILGNGWMVCKTKYLSRIFSTYIIAHFTSDVSVSFGAHAFLPLCLSALRAVAEVVLHLLEAPTLPSSDTASSALFSMESGGIAFAGQWLGPILPKSPLNERCILEDLGLMNVKLH